ncbi:hypothetical protein IFM89_003868 [Coptis chinensis]|uniref:Lethal giant larvae (Lgl)-like C-terminal domain-containing protein n=1 Tax=Coptis chinensis TaxID=261450 RepID=A0A835I2M8_9MAGN|nr:hypothetical protein IFM89_003868 [Coptis chinensis]
MFVKKFVEKAVKKPGGGNINSIKASELNPRVAFHYGIPSGSIKLAYDSIQKILAISTKDGRIKLLGKDITQALLQSNDAVPSKFMQVWDIERKQLCDVFILKEDITSFTVVQQTSYAYIGDSGGNISVLKLDLAKYHLVQMNYRIPLSASHGNTTEVADDNAVLFIMPQPMAESQRVLIIFRDGLIVLWGLEECKGILVMGGNMLSLSNETKKVTSSCWACPFGSKVVVGYSNGEVYLWSVPPLSNPGAISANRELTLPQNVPLCKLNLGYKMDKIPILSLKWVYGNGKSSRLYVNGASNSASSNLFQIVLLNEQTTSRTIKLVLPLLEPSLDMEVISSNYDQSKQKQDSLLLLLKSGRLCFYDDSVIEKYLMQSQSRSAPSLPKQVMVKLPFADSGITIAKFVTDGSNFISGMDEDYDLLVKHFPPLLPSDSRAKDQLNLARFSGYAKITNLYITGHSDGTINFWDLSSPLLLRISSIQQQSEDDHSLSGIPVTALYFDISSQNFVTGDQSGTVRIFKFKPESFSLQASTKKGSNNIVQSVKLVKVNGVVLSINLSIHSKHIAVGSDQGYVSVINMEGPTILFQIRIMNEVCNDVVSLHFETCSFHGFEKKVLLVGMKDSSVVAVESDTGNTFSTTSVRPKKPARVLFMQVLDASSSLDSSGGYSVEDASPKQSLLLLCNEKAVYVYSLIHAVQGIKRVLHKKKFHGTTCCWASAFNNHDSEVALALLFPGGKIDIRSLPELSLLKEVSIRGFAFQNLKSDSSSDSSLSSSSDGEIILIHGNQELFLLSLLLRKEIYRFLDPISQVYKGVMAIEEETVTGPIIQKEKKKGIFNSVLKDIKANKAKYASETEVPNSTANIADELSNIFSIPNFPLDKETREHVVADEKDAVELNIDDIDIEDENPKGHNTIAVLNKKKLTSKFLAIKGKLKQKMIRNEKGSAKPAHEDENGDTVDQIKKKYGFSSSGDSSVAKLTENKLHENITKLKGINIRATEMQGTAQSFSAMAKDVLRTAERDKPNS